MRHQILLYVVLVLTFCAVAGFLGCSKMKPCTVTPVEIEELKSDIRDVDGQLASAKEALARVQADLASWEERLAERRSEIPQLEAELARLKKASGVTVTLEKDEPADQSAADF